MLVSGRSVIIYIKLEYSTVFEFYRRAPLIIGCSPKNGAGTILEYPMAKVAERLNCNDQFRATDSKRIVVLNCTRGELIV